MVHPKVLYSTQYFQGGNILKDNIQDFQVMKLNVEANMLRIQQLLGQEDIQKQFKEDRWYSCNKDNVELRARLKALRKDTLRLERLCK